MKEAISKNITWHQGGVSREERMRALNAKPMTVWLTGLSASGKSTLAFALERALIEEGLPAYVLDGDNVRHGLSKDLGFSADDREENIRRVAEVAKLLNDAGLIVISAFISPLIKDREMAKGIIGESFFNEVHISTPLNVCESRDPKGLYAKARAGKLGDFTGISAPYEAPLSPNLKINTDQHSLEECISILLDFVRNK
jgi:adenylylsulfate kinase